MVQSSSMPYTPMVEAARKGNLRAIATWLNQILRPYDMRVRVGAKRPGMLKLLVEFDFPLDPENPPNVWREQLVRLICHRLWKLNSPLIDGVSITARFLEQPQRPVWRRSVKIVTPASRRKRQHTTHLRSQIRQTSRRKRRLRTARTLLVGGPAIAAVMVGGILGYTRAPVSRTEANAAAQRDPAAPSLPTRPDTVRTALETVSVVKHNDVANPQDPTVTLMFSGDVTLADNFKDVMGNRYDQTFAQMPEYKQADLAMVNLENPLTRATIPLPGKQFNFKADPESINVLKSGGVDLVTLANNHTMDYNAEGLKETIATLDQAGIEHMGAGDDATHARRPQIIDVKGQRIAYLAYWGDEYGAEANKPGINNIREENIAADIHAIRDQVDWIVVNYHWGQELADFPADWQVKLAHFTIDQGADLVVGHHPHVLQGAEIYKGRAIAYSLGNFIFGGNSRTDYDTAVLRVALKDRQMKVDFLPVEVKDYQPRVVQGDRGKDILNHLTQISAEFKQPMPPSTVLDARTLNTPNGNTAQTESFIPGGSSTPIQSAPTNTPITAPAPAAGTKANDGAASPDALTGPAAPDGGPGAAPLPSPKDQNILPGYGGTPVPMPSPVPSIDPLNPDTYLEPAPAAPATPTSGVPGSPSNPATETSAPPDPTATSSPQLPSIPTAGDPGNSSANPANPPLNLNQAAPAEPPQDNNTQGSVPHRADSASISFQIQPKAPTPTMHAAKPSEQSEEEPLEVALAGPMMW